MVTYKYLQRGQEQYITEFRVCSASPAGIDRINDANGLEIIEDSESWNYPYEYRTEQMPIMTEQDDGDVIAYIQSVNKKLKLPETFKMVAPFRVEAVINSAALGVQVGDVIAFDGLYQGTPFIINFVTSVGRTIQQDTEHWRMPLKVIDTNRAVVCKDTGFYLSGESDRLVDLFYEMRTTGINGSSWGKIKKHSLSEISEALEPTLELYKSIYGYLYFKDNPAIMCTDYGTGRFPRYDSVTPTQVNNFIDANTGRTDIALILAVVQFNTTGNAEADAAAKKSAATACRRLITFARQQKQCIYAVMPMEYHESTDEQYLYQRYTARYDMKDEHQLPMGGSGEQNQGVPLPTTWGLFLNVFRDPSSSQPLYLYYPIDTGIQENIYLPENYQAIRNTPIV